jgi:acylphosphatase
MLGRRQPGTIIMTATRSVHVRIEGDVQGVGYRAWVASTARTLGLNGWVRNRRDSSVELAIEGPSEDVAEMLRKCERGPPEARVTKIEILDEAPRVHAGFEVLPTV